MVKVVVTCSVRDTCWREFPLLGLANYYCINLGCIVISDTVVVFIIIIITNNLLFDELVADNDCSLDGVGVHDLGRVVQSDVRRKVKLLVVDILQQ